MAGIVQSGSRMIHFCSGSVACSGSPLTGHLIKVKPFACGIISKERMRKIKHYSNDNNDTPNTNKQDNKPWWFVWLWAPSQAQMGYGCWLTLGQELLQVGEVAGISCASVGVWSPLSSPYIYGSA